MDAVRTVCLITALTVLFEAEESQCQNIAAMFPAIMNKERESMQQPCEDNSNKYLFDFIVVGAGIAGSVVANRLTEEKCFTVLLLEAGDKGTAIMNVPMAAFIFEGTDAAWHYKTVPSETDFSSFSNRQVNYRTARGLGGGSSINYMVAVRGNSHVYDNWERLGNKGWKFESIKKYFKRMENMQIKELVDNDYHSTEGNVKISYAPYRSELSSAFIQGGKEMGFSEVDYNGANQTGFSLSQCTMANGTRWSASRGYLAPIRSRNNFYLRPGALVTKILFRKPNIAVGVQYTRGGKSYTVYARREVILSAGAMKTPQLLMISGIGPREHLEKLGINVIKDSKVGYNVMDHAVFLGLNVLINETVDPNKNDIIDNNLNFYNYFVNNNGPLTNNMGVQAISFIPSDTSKGYADLATVYLSPPLIDSLEMATLLGLTKEVVNEYYKPLFNHSSYWPLLYAVSPQSRGRITLNNKDINSNPNFDPAIFTNENDIQVTISGIRKMIEHSKKPALQRFGAKIYDVPLPPCKHLKFGSDEYWRCGLKQFSVPILHVAGSCKMGPSSDVNAVVDPNLRVRGVKNLRVVDVSIMPQLPSSHTQIPAYMIGEKGADLIKEDHINDCRIA